MVQVTFSSFIIPCWFLYFYFFLFPSCFYLLSILLVNSFHCGSFFNPLIFFVPYIKYSQNHGKYYNKYNLFLCRPYSILCIYSHAKWLLFEVSKTKGTTRINDVRFDGPEIVSQFSRWSCLSYLLNFLYVQG